MMDRSRVGPFALEEPLAGSQSNSVYRAVHIEQRRSFAIRFVAAPMLQSNEAARRAFTSEFESLRKLRHPNVVACKGGGTTNMEAFYVHELVHGQSLTELLVARDRLPWETVVEYALQLAGGLAAAHELELVHGELSPDKILINEDGQLKILDFRLNRQNDPNWRRPHERKEAESLAFMAPEQLADPPLTTAKCDLYALGCIMFRLLTGQTPFAAFSSDEMIEAHRVRQPPRVSSIVLECPVWLDVLIGQMLEKKPDKRPHSAQTVILALKETQKKVAKGTGVAEHMLSGLSALQPDADKKEVRRLLGREKKKKRRRHKQAPFYESSWFLALCLFGLLAMVVAWIAWPVGPETLIRRADRLMSTGDRYQWEKARRWYLEPLLTKYPEGKPAERARRHMDKIEMDLAERRLRVNTRLGRPPRSEGERLFADAWNYEQFGDRVTAVQKYESLINLLDEKGPERPYVNLARRQIAGIEAAANEGDSQALIEEQLARANRLVEEGKLKEARKIWTSVVTLYGNNQETRPLVQKAQDKLLETEEEKPASDTEPDAT